MSAPELQRRLDDLTGAFDAYVERYDRTVPFVRSGQFASHHQTIARRRHLGSAVAAIGDAEFCRLLHTTLQAWGIGRRGSRLLALDDFSERLAACAAAVEPLQSLRLEDPDLDVAAVAATLDQLIGGLGVVDNRALVVAGTKTLHHLLPDLVPPMDRAWTGAFFGWNTLDPQNHQSAIFTEASTSLAAVAVAVEPSRLVGEGWRTSPSKVVDNAVIAYCREHGIGRD